jgi:alanyl-tRNA synthetase
VDAERRARTMRNHTATHLLHRALRNTVGERARQAGSLVTPDNLRFDFPFERPLGEEDQRAIEAEVRRVVREDRPVLSALMTMAEAIALGADAFFDEKYGETVRTVAVEGYSRELCGGTHCRATGQIGGFHITAERSIGSGMRRIEAVTGDAADALTAERFAILERTAAAAAARSLEAVPERVSELQARVRELEGRLRAGATAERRRPDELAEGAETVAGARYLGAAVAFESMAELKIHARDVRAALGSGVIAFVLEADEPQLFVTVSDDLVARGITADRLVAAAAPHIAGRGGGRPQMAQARGTRRAGTTEALAAIRGAMEHALEGKAG